jgi:hypothetical protein
MEGKSKAVPVTGCRDPKCCETLRFPRFVDNRLTDGCDVSLRRRLRSIPRKIPVTNF